VFSWDYGGPKSLEKRVGVGFIRSFMQEKLVRMGKRNSEDASMREAGLMNKAFASKNIYQSGNGKSIAGISILPCDF